MCRPEDKPKAPLFLRVADTSLVLRNKLGSLTTLAGQVELLATNLGLDIDQDKLTRRKASLEAQQQHQELLQKQAAKLSSAATRPLTTPFISSSSSSSKRTLCATPKSQQQQHQQQSAAHAIASSFVAQGSLSSAILPPAGLAAAVFSAPLYALGQQQTSEQQKQQQQLYRDALFQNAADEDDDHSGNHSASRRGGNGSGADGDDSDNPAGGSSSLRRNRKRQHSNASAGSRGAGNGVNNDNGKNEIITPTTKRRKRSTKHGSSDSIQHLSDGNNSATERGHKRIYVSHNYHDYSSTTMAAATIKIEIDPATVTSSSFSASSLQLTDIVASTAAAATERKGRGGIASPFPAILHRMLEQAEADGYARTVSWQPHGRAFLVHDQATFVSTVMPQFFRQTRFSSFQRQLSLYGFLRLTRKGRDHGAYYHEMFLRGRPTLAARIQRTRVKGYWVRQSSSPDTEPDFYSMPAVGSNSNINNATAANENTHYSPLNQKAIVPAPFEQQQQQQQLVMSQWSTSTTTDSSLTRQAVLTSTSTTTAAAAPLGGEFNFLDGNDLLLKHFQNQEQMEQFQQQQQQYQPISYHQQQQQTVVSSSQENTFQQQQPQQQQQDVQPLYILGSNLNSLLQPLMGAQRVAYSPAGSDNNSCNNMLLLQQQQHHQNQQQQQPMANTCSISSSVSDMLKRTCNRIEELPLNQGTGLLGFKNATLATTTATTTNSMAIGTSSSVPCMRSTLSGSFAKDVLDSKYNYHHSQQQQHHHHRSHSVNTEDLCRQQISMQLQQSSSHAQPLFQHQGQQQQQQLQFQQQLLQQQANLRRQQQELNAMLAQPLQQQESDDDDEDDDAASMATLEQLPVSSNHDLAAFLSDVDIEEFAGSPMTPLMQPKPSPQQPQQQQALTKEKEEMYRHEEALGRIGAGTYNPVSNWGTTQGSISTAHRDNMVQSYQFHQQYYQQRQQQQQLQQQIGTSSDNQSVQSSYLQLGALQQLQQPNNVNGHPSFWSV